MPITATKPKGSLLCSNIAKIAIAGGALGAGSAMTLGGNLSVNALIRNIASPTNLSLHQDQYTIQQISSLLVQNANTGYVDGLIAGAGMALVAAGAITAFWYAAKHLTENIALKSKKTRAVLTEIAHTGLGAAGLVIATAVGAGLWRAYDGIMNASRNIQYYRTLGGGSNWYTPVGNGLYAGGVYCPGLTTASCYSLSDYMQIVVNGAYNNGVDTSLGLAMFAGSAYLLIRFLLRVDWKGADKKEEAS